MVSDTSTLVGGHIISEYEKITYYHGISPDPPELLYRSDLETNPFPSPKGRFPHLGVKTAHGVFGTPLNPVWHTVAPQIVSVLKSRGIRYSALKATRFTTTVDETGKNGPLGPIVIWVATHPGSTTPEDAHDVSPTILNILETNQVQGAVVEWYEGVVEKLAGPALLRATDSSNPTHYVRRTFTATLGMPIATKEREDEDSQGSVAFFFHENKTKSGTPSQRVLGVSNAHVLRKDPTIDYELEGAGAPRQMVRVAGMRRYQRTVEEIEALIASNVTEISTLAQEISRLKVKPQSDDNDEAADDRRALNAKQDQLTKLNAENDELQRFWKTVTTQWRSLSNRDIGYVDWAHKITSTVSDAAGFPFTLDLATFVLDPTKFKPHFRGNIVDLGTKFTEHELKNKFYPSNNSRKVLLYPSDRMLHIDGFVAHEKLAKPDCYDSNGEPCLVVMKDGNTSDLTVGRYAGLEAYTSDDLGVESIDLAIYNYDKKSGPFAEKGDSGSLVFDGEGHMIGILHSGMLKGTSNHVTYATPAYFALQQIKARYPNAVFTNKVF